MSFSSEVKNEITKINKIKKCCAFSFLYGIMCFSNFENGTLIQKKTNVENTCFYNELFKLILKDNYKIEKGKLLLNKEIIRCFTIAEYNKTVFKCVRCKEYFLKGLFLIYGTVNDPNKSYRLELVLSSIDSRNQIEQLLISFGLSPKTTIRNNKYVIYFNRSEEIENFLILMGANNSAFKIMNSKISKEIRNTANRATNCDSANISKAIKASEKYTKAIKYLKSNNKLDKLTDELRVLANAKLNFPELSLSDLGQKLSPPVSKSGVYHRLERIMKVYKECSK